MLLTVQSRILLLSATLGVKVPLGAKHASTKFEPGGGACSGCDATESVRWCRGKCSRCYDREVWESLIICNCFSVIHKFRRIQNQHSRVSVILNPNPIREAALAVGAALPRLRGGAKGSVYAAMPGRCGRV